MFWYKAVQKKVKQLNIKYAMILLFDVQFGTKRLLKQSQMT